MAGSFELSTDLVHARTMAIAIPTGGVDEGEVLQINSGIYVFVLATADPSSTDIHRIPSTETYTGIVQCDQCTANHTTGATADQGTAAYWDGAGVTNASTGNTLIGYFLEDVASADTTCEIFFDGSWSLLV